MTIYDEYVAAMKREFPGLRIVSKDGDALSRVIDLFLECATLGGQRGYLDRYTTVIGKTIFVPIGWEKRTPEERYCTMRHEAVHLRQSKRYGFLGMAARYLLGGLPIGLAWGRARIEWEAYEETFRAWADVYGPARAHDPALRAHVVKQFTSPAYLWMWPFPEQVNRWVDEVLATIPKSGA